MIKFGDRTSDLNGEWHRALDARLPWTPATRVHCCPLCVQTPASPTAACLCYCRTIICWRYLWTLESFSWWECYAWSATWQAGWEVGGAGGGGLVERCSSFTWTERTVCIYTVQLYMDMLWTCIIDAQGSCGKFEHLTFNLTFNVNPFPTRPPTVPLLYATRIFCPTAVFGYSLQVGSR